MATIKYYLDSRQPLKDGTLPLKVRLTVKNSNSMIPLEVYLLPEQWDADKQVIKGLKNKDVLNRYIQHQFMNIQDSFFELRMEGKLKGKTATAIKNMITHRMNGDINSVKEPLFVDSYISYIGRIKAKGTRNSYNSTLKHLRAFNAQFDSLAFSEIDRVWVQSFVAYLSNNGIADNTIVSYIRCFKAVWNDARLNGVTDKYPFFKLRLSRTPTRKRNLSAERIRELFSMQMDAKVQCYLDVFKLMFLLMGINTADLYSLTPASIRNGRIEYVRHKTKRFYSILVPNEAMKIINTYKGKEHLLSLADKHTFATFREMLSKALHQVSEEITPYYSRHSWATIASKVGISKDVIAQALGHGGNTVTDVYIEFDMKKVDEANRKVIDYVLYDKI